jgi:hypothetical protein
MNKPKFNIWDKVECDNKEALIYIVGTEVRGTYHYGICYKNGILDTKSELNLKLIQRGE